MYCLVVFSVEVFGEVVGKVFLAWVPCDVEVAQGNLVGDAEKTHFHGPGSLFLDRVIGDADGSEVIAVDWGWRLFVPQFF